MGSSTPLGSPGDAMPGDEMAYRERLEEVQEEKRAALLDPGPPWKEWFLHDGAKWWVGLGFLVIDTWFVAGGLEGGLLALGLVLLIPTTYLEFLLWRFLWYRPPFDRPVRGDFHRSWIRPVEFGRWTPEGNYVQAHGRAALGPQGPNPREFI
ncbi:MAG: hypothetical protein L3K02_07390 [Thermoplasmata archaeon]|nr:hypothetical protein [Thermoplasmata archaeon]